MSNDLTLASATRLAHLVRTRAVSAVEVVEVHLRRIEAVNPRINAVIQLDAERALDTARGADAAVARGDAVGRLHGVPITVKDWIEVEGLICAAGSVERASYFPRRDATAVARLRAAGAIVLGKTNVGDGAPLHPRPCNPYDFERTPGLSSSGEAAVVGAGASPCGLGSDSGGSIRLPAAWCGIAALKPTNGLVPLTGHFPPIGPLSDPRTVIGPLARRVEDLGLLLSIIAGVDGRDPSVNPVAVGDPAWLDLRGLRVAHYSEFAGAVPTAEVRDAVDAAVRSLTETGAIAGEAQPPRLDEVLPITEAYWRRSRSVSLSEWRPHAGRSRDVEEVERSLFEWERLRRAFLRFMENWDVIISPATADAAPLHRTVAGADFIYTLPYSLTGYPVAVVRAGTSADGLPLAVQIAARPWCDHVAIAAAAQIERQLGGWQPPLL